MIGGKRLCVCWWYWLGVCEYCVCGIVLGLFCKIAGGCFRLVRLFSLFRHYKDNKRLYHWLVITHISVRRIDGLHLLLLIDRRGLLLFHGTKKCCSQNGRLWVNGFG